MTIWQQIAVCFYQNEIADGMDLFDAIERADYTYAADLLYHEIQGE